MITFSKKKLANGLTILVLPDSSTPLSVVNILYKVGSRNEQSQQTGFAHLFEHFMFEGSKNIDDFDTELETASGENNAFTTNDFTNYYEIIPKENIETALWLESDRMLSLAFEDESLATQKKVVCEEFKEHYINPPYGDSWHLLSALAYKAHPYQWPVIGKELSHIENATMPSVKDFFKRYYAPSNAILCIAGDLDFATGFSLAEKWFGDIEDSQMPLLPIVSEPTQNEYRVETVYRDVPADAVYFAFKMCERLSAEYYTIDLIRDILSTGESSRLYQELVKKENLFSSVSCYLTETIDEGLLVIEAKLHNETTIERATTAIFACLQSLSDSIDEKELQKVKNKMEAYLTFSDVNLLNRATNLCYFEMLGNTELINQEIDKYLAVTLVDIKKSCATLFQKNNCSQLNYLSNKQSHE